MTEFCVTYQFHHDLQVRSSKFSTMLQRSLFVISISGYAKILKEWEQ